MATIAKPYCVTIWTWLKQNLGRDCLTGLTGTDFKALRAAVQIVELWSYWRRPEAAKAFGLVVRGMQEKERELAFHAIAHVCDWGHRAELWALAGLPSLGRVRICKYDSRGMMRWREEQAAREAARRAAAQAAMDALRRENDAANGVAAGNTMGGTAAALDPQAHGQDARATRPDNVEGAAS